MPTLGNYCKAYPVDRFREYENWTEKSETGAEEQYLFLQENLSVTNGIFLDENIVFDAVTPEWEQFCRNQLEFQIPPEALPDSRLGTDAHTDESLSAV